MIMRAHYAVRLLAGTLIGRLPNGMAPLAILLLIQHEGGTLALAGALCALYSLAAALGQPVLGRLVDRHGQTLTIRQSHDAAALRRARRSGLRSLRDDDADGAPGGAEHLRVGSGSARPAGGRPAQPRAATGPRWRSTPAARA